jgi:hypothetical protein
MPRSGSTLLNLMLGQLPDFVDVGELYYVWSSGVIRDELCACGQPFSQCAFWSQVGKHAYGGWGEVDAQRVLRLQRQVDTTGRLIRASVLRSRSYDETVAEYLEIIEPLYAAVAATSGAGVVVDSTKRPSTAYLLARSTRIDLRVVHLVRDPRGVVNAWSRQIPIPDGTGPRPYMKKRSMRQILRRWITVNGMVGRLARSGVPTVRIRYEDLVRDPGLWLRRTAELSAVDLTSDVLSFLADGAGVRSVSHAATGGRVRMSTEPLRLNLDERWRHELPRWRQGVVRVAAGSLMRRYGYK